MLLLYDANGPNLGWRRSSSATSVQVSVLHISSGASCALYMQQSTPESFCISPCMSAKAVDLSRSRQPTVCTFAAWGMDLRAFESKGRSVSAGSKHQTAKQSSVGFSWESHAITTAAYTMSVASRVNTILPGIPPAPFQIGHKVARRLAWIVG